MKKKLILFFAPFVCIIALITIFFLLNSGKCNIEGLMKETLNKSITTDYYRRYYEEVKYIGIPLKRKLKEITIVSEKGREHIVFKDSVEEYLAQQLVNQYVMAAINPVNPDKFNEIFKECLVKNGLTAKTGIIYINKDKKEYSENDTISFAKAIVTQPVSLDVYKKIKVKGWCICDFYTELRYANMNILWGAVLIIIACFLILLYENKRKKNLRKNINKYLKR